MVRTGFFYPCCIVPCGQWRLPKYVAINGVRVYTSYTLLHNRIGIFLHVYKHVGVLVLLFDGGRSFVFDASTVYYRWALLGTGATRRQR